MSNDKVGGLFAELLEPVNDIMEPILKQNGAVSDTVRYLGQANGKWLGVPACTGSQIQSSCSRIDLMKKYANIDVQAMYPAGSPPKADNWTMDTFLKTAEACHKGGFPFGIGLGEIDDNVGTAGAIFQSFGAHLVDAEGNLTVKTDEMRQALEFYRKLIAFLPPDVAAWDKCLQQQMVDFWQGCADHEPAERLGGRKAGRTASCRVIVDPRLRGRP